MNEIKFVPKLGAGGWHWSVEGFFADSAVPPSQGHVEVVGCVSTRSLHVSHPNVTASPAASCAQCPAPPGTEAWVLLQGNGRGLGIAEQQTRRLDIPCHQTSNSGCQVLSLSDHDNAWEKRH